MTYRTKDVGLPSLEGEHKTRKHTNQTNEAEVGWGRATEVQNVSKTRVKASPVATVHGEHGNESAKNI